MNQPPLQRGTGISGKWVLLALFGGALLMVPLATWATLRWVESGIIETPRLNWENRERWPSPPVRWTVMSRQGLQLSPDAGSWRELDFHLTDHDQAVLDQCLELARMAERQPATFVQPAIGSLLRQLAEQAPDNFYPTYLLGTWHRLRDEPDFAAAAYRSAMQRAHGVVKQRYITPDDQPIANLAVGTFALTHARSDGHQLDDSLTLIYPALTTDADGLVYLPVYQTVYRVDRSPQPVGYDVQYRFEQWFEFPGRIGTLRPAVVRPAR